MPHDHPFGQRAASLSDPATNRRRDWPCVGAGMKITRELDRIRRAAPNAVK